jgi:hypothetical protein
VAEEHKRPDDATPRERREDEDLVTAGKGIGEAFGLDQPTDEPGNPIDRPDEVEGRDDDDTPNPAEISP